MPGSSESDALPQDPHGKAKSGALAIDADGSAGSAADARPPKKEQGGPLQIPSLDGIRAISFLIVFIAHAGLGRVMPGYFGLSIFFFLSGYLITTLMRQEYDRTGTVGLKQFYLRRTLRIFPPLYLVLAMACVPPLLGWVRGSVWWETVLAQAAHLTNYYIIYYGWWDGIAPGTWVYWSLAVEEHFYLFFPLVYLGLRRYCPSGRSQALVLLGMCAAILAWRCGLVLLLDATKERTYIATDTRVDAILVGCILAVWQNPMLDRGAVSDRALLFLWVPLGLASVLTSLLVRGPVFEQTIRYTLQSFGLFPLFIAAIRWHDRGLVRALNWPLVRRLGMLSYSLYLMHTAVIWALEERTKWGAPLRATVAFLVLLVLASLMYRFVEKPFARLRQRLSRATQPRAAKDSRGAATVAA